MSDSTAQQPDSEVPADVLAQTLFIIFVIGDEGTRFYDLLKDWESHPTFRPDTFRFQLFAYLVATVALALTHEYSRQPNSVKVITALKRLVTAEAVQREVSSVEDLDDAIEKAASKLHDLLFTDPQAKPAYCFEWAREWLKLCGIDEYNPQVLFEFSYRWKSGYVALRKSIKETCII